MNTSEIVCVCHAFDWIIKDRAGPDEQTIIDCWAFNRDSKPCLLRITNFPIFCMIELPRFLRNQKYEHKWSKYETSVLIDDINTTLKTKIKSCEFLHCQTVYYYQGNDKTPFMRCFFNNIKEMKNCKYKLENAFRSEHYGWIKINMWEDDISCVRKLLTIKNVRYSKWFQVKGVLVPDEEKVSTLVEEYNIDWTTMTPIKDEICKDWMTNPGILSFDIETYSDAHNAMPNRYVNGHLVYMISCIFKKYKIPNTLKRYGIIIGDCNQIPAERLDQCTLIHVTNEVTLVDAFGQVVKETDPDIMIGYNILGYDYPYVDHRLKRQIKQWPSSFSRIIGETPKMTSNNWVSKAYGHNALNTLNMSGRISIDLLPVVRRDYKFESYTLNYVSKKFINKQKMDISAKEMFSIFEQLQEAVFACEKEQTQDNLDKLEKAKEKTTEVMEYCIRDSELCIELMEKLDVWVGMIELSNIVGVTIVEIFTKGQQVRCVSQLYDLAAKRNYVLNKREAPTYGFKGGSVQKPIPGLYDCIICLDFKSLYPSIIQAFNICYTTLVSPQHVQIIPDDQCHVIEFDQELGKKRDEHAVMSSSSDDEEEEKEEEEEVTVRRFKIKFYKHKEGLLPLLVKNLVAERNQVRKLQKTETNPLVWMVLEKRQLALKVSANSFFGFLGVQEGGKMPCIEAAMSITAKGRELIAAVGTYLYDKYQAKIVYGDSVTHDTPILIKQHGKIYNKTIDTLGTEWVSYHGDKESSYCDDFVWSDQGWTKIHRIIRHKTHKTIYGIRTGLGYVKVTSDHSLLDHHGQKIKPTEVIIGSRLLHTTLPWQDNKDALSSCDRNDDKDVISDTCIQEITNLGQTNHFVYDLQTDNHHFCAGWGSIVVHNTDSVMVDMNIKDRKECKYWGECRRFITRSKCIKTHG